MAGSSRPALGWGRPAKGRGHEGFGQTVGSQQGPRGAAGRALAMEGPHRVARPALGRRLDRRGGVPLGRRPRAHALRRRGRPVAPGPDLGHVPGLDDRLPRSPPLRPCHGRAGRALPGGARAHARALRGERARPRRRVRVAAARASRGRGRARPREAGEVRPEGGAVRPVPVRGRAHRARRAGPGHDAAGAVASALRPERPALPHGRRRGGQPLQRGGGAGRRDDRTGLGPDRLGHARRLRGGRGVDLPAGRVRAVVPPPEHAPRPRGRLRGDAARRRRADRVLRGSDRCPLPHVHRRRRGPPVRRPDRPDLLLPALHRAVTADRRGRGRRRRPAGHGRRADHRADHGDAGGAAAARRRVGSRAGAEGGRHLHRPVHGRREQLLLDRARARDRRARARIAGVQHRRPLRSRALHQLQSAGAGHARLPDRGGLPRDAGHGRLRDR